MLTYWAENKTKPTAYSRNFTTYALLLKRVFVSSGRQPKDNPSFFCNIILDVAQYFHATSLRKSRQLSPSKAAFSLDEREVTWLCFHAFDTCLRKMQSRYKALLIFLKSGLSRLGRPAEDMKKVTDASQHIVFKKIRWSDIMCTWMVSHSPAACLGFSTRFSPNVSEHIPTSPAGGYQFI